MPINSLSDLYVEELRDLYSAETQLVEALPKIAEAAHSADLKFAVRMHLAQTKGHVERLDNIFTALGEKPTGHFCMAMEGLLKEGEQAVNEIDIGGLRDAAIICGAQKIEHYEIAGYGTCKAFAKLLGEDVHVQILQKTLDEESAADRKLTAIAEESVNGFAVLENVNNTAVWTKVD